MRLATLPHFVIIALLAIQASPLLGQDSAQPKAGATAASKSEPQCRSSGRDQVTIACDYSSTSGSESARGAETRIVLTHALLFFQPTDESHMRVELTFKNEGSKPVSDMREAYLAVDDDAGQNYVRRILSHVDLQKLAPGQSLTFVDVLLVGAFRAGHYTVHLWIPSSDPALKFDSSKNLLLSSEGVADPSTGLNTLATFNVAR